MTQVASFDDADRFLKLARTFLLQAPRRNTIILSVVDRLRGTFGHGARFYVMDGGSAVIGAAMQTPPFRLFLAASVIPRPTRLRESNPARPWVRRGRSSSGRSPPPNAPTRTKLLIPRF